MKRILLLLIVSLAALPLAAQYVPPARDFQEATRLAGECARAILPGLTAMREHHEVLGLFNRVQKQLADDNAGALTSALDTIDEWVRQRQQADQGISPDMKRQLDKVRDLIADTKNGPPPTDLRPLRETIHHDHIHALQRLVLTNASQLQAFADGQQQLERAIRELVRASITAASTGAQEVKR